MNVRNDFLSKEQIQEIINNYLLNYGQIPTFNNLKRNLGVTVTNLNKVGGYKNLLVEMGFGHLYHTRVKLTKEEVSKKLYNFASSLDYVDCNAIDVAYQNNQLSFGYGIVRFYFGSFYKFAKENGLHHLIKYSKQDYFTKEEMSLEILKLFPNKTNPPTMQEIENSGSFFSPTTLQSKFGSYTSMLNELGYDMPKGNFGHHCITSDGIVCDSKSELKVYEFLLNNNIGFECHMAYKNVIKNYDGNFKMDFLLPDNTVVEYFGLAGNKRYDEKLRKKVDILEKNNIKYIAIYPNDLNKLDKIFKEYLRGDGI